jgi:RimJ/RimL family protein N-acetyltransferase
MTDVDAGRLRLRPIGRDAARAVLDGRPPNGVTLAPGYPSQFSLEVMEMVAGARPDAPDGYGPYFMVRKADDAVVGEIGADLNGATAQVGYTVVEPSWGQGTPPRPCGRCWPTCWPTRGSTGWWPRPWPGTRPAAG